MSASSSLPYPLPHTASVVQKKAQTMFLLKSDPSTKLISISVDGAASHTWSIRIPPSNWQAMVPGVESSINSAFQNDSSDIKVTVSYQDMEESKTFSTSKVDLAFVLGAVVPQDCSTES